MLNNFIVIHNIFDTLNGVKALARCLRASSPSDAPRVSLRLRCEMTHQWASLRGRSRGNAWPGVRAATRTTREHHLNSSGGGGGGGGSGGEERGFAGSKGARGGAAGSESALDGDEERALRVLEDGVEVEEWVLCAGVGRGESWKLSASTEAEVNIVVAPLFILFHI